MTLSSGLRTVAGDAGRLARLTRDLPSLLRARLAAEDAMAIVRQRLATREERFLHLTGRLIYGHARSPYRRLLAAVGCELGDLRALVLRKGLEEALAQLAAAGVYVTYDEFKGRKEAVRGNQRFFFTEEDFDNPTIAPHFETRSGGTRSHGTPVKIDLAFLDDQAVNTVLTAHVHSLLEHDHAIWLQHGFTPALLYARAGRPPLAWFYLLRTLPFKIRAGGYYMAALARLFGSRLPAPVYLDVRDPARMVSWLGRRLEEGRSLCLTTYASSAVRVAAAAVEMGVSLRNVCFITLGEPFTEARQRIVQASGARALVRYAFTEAGILGYGCPHPRVSDDLHLFDDSYALIQRARAVGQDGPTVDAFLVTSLLPTAPKILLNVENGDYGTVERRTCGCGFDSIGLRNHVARVRSFEKLTGEGLTFVQTDLLRVLEITLPARFGGTGTDYQVLETEGADGITRLVLMVSPGIGPVDEELVRRVFLDELGGDGQSAALWRRVDTVQVKRQWPEATKAGKILPFHLVRA